MEFPILCRVGMDRNENFFFLSYSAYPISFWLEMKPQWCFLIFWIFLLFFWNSLFLVGLEWIGTRIFFFSHSRPVPSSFGLKWSHNDVLWIFKFFYYFFGIPYSRSGWNGSEWEYFCSLILSWSSPVLALKEAILMFFNFLIFLLFFRNSIFRIG